MSKSLSGKKVGILVETEFIHEEIEYYKKRIPELGGELVLLSYLWGKASMDIVNDIDHPDRPITSVHRLTITECVTKYEPEHFDVIICAANYVAVRLREIPPMRSIGSPSKMSTPPAVAFFAKAMTNKKIVKAAMCHALWILTPRPDLLQSRKVICHTVVLSDIVNAGAVFVPAPNHVVIDRDLVTARSFADVDNYMDAIVTSVEQIEKPVLIPTTDKTAKRIFENLADRLKAAAENFNPMTRPIAKAAQRILDGSMDIAAEVNRILNVDLTEKSPALQNKVLIVCSKFGTWASEFTIVAGVLLKAGYKVQVATEDGSPPHFLSPSLDPTFEDGAWRCSVVSPPERDLALRFLKPGNSEHHLLARKNILNLSNLPKPPQIGDYIKDPLLLEKYHVALRDKLQLAKEFDAIIVAGGSGAIPGLMFDRGLHSLILAFHDLEKPIMGECNGGLAIAQTIDPDTDKSILAGRAVTTHSWLDEYQAGWGWVSSFPKDPETFWNDDKFDMDGYVATEIWHAPGLAGNPLIDSSALFKNASSIGGLFYSPPGTPYAVVVDGNFISCRTTPDGYPGVLALLAILQGKPPLSGRFFIDQNHAGRSDP